MLVPQPPACPVARAGVDKDATFARRFGGKSYKMVGRYGFSR